ncbi:hypothetical protein ACJIZ3_009782 [Penstemon smallii]|uniref:Fanconi-associated nuclease n=1 Tax=Penstemon smallii TaxID=265156 RepID=A0ABD3TEK2_9LAMI
MLKGRESLLRVIGKRRRFLPNRHSILSSSSSSQSCCKIDDNEKKYSPEKERSVESVDEEEKKCSPEKERSDELVNCPICGAQLPSVDNNIINSHLDKCLARGSKRKLGQLTLLQLNFSRSKVKVHSMQPEDEGNGVILSDPIKSSTCDTVNNFIEAHKTEEDNNQKESTFHSLALKSNSFSNCVENPFADDTTNNRSASAPFLLEIEKSKNVTEECTDEVDISKLNIPTFIVGRRFGVRQDLDPESRICLSREPGNVKDTNAIKVLYADCEHDNMLGYLPRELAQYLSPLMDKFHLKFQARMISVPKNSGAAIPIQIVCDNMLLCDEKFSDNIQVYKSLWRHALCAAELGKTGSFGMTRYQHNMVLLVEEVLKNNSHVLTIREKSFLEAFLSLPDDSQRLFARLYTRKGPWFRMSNVSYAEITDCDQAIKGLLEEGYIVSFPWRNELEDDNFEEVLNLLNIDELREASSMLNKKCHHGTRKHDIIDLLRPSCKDGLCPQLQCFLLSRTGACVRISPLAESLIWRAERLFFLNGEQDLSAFLLVDLGIIKYPAYKCIISEHIFSNRSDLLSYEEAIEIAQFMDESLDENNSNSVYRCIEISVSRLSISLEESKSSTAGTMVTFLSYFSASWIYSKVVLLGVSFLEHEKSVRSKVYKCCFTRSIS